jgi:hypothetical protein
MEEPGSGPEERPRGHRTAREDEETSLILQVDVEYQRSLCVVNDQPVGNPKRKV